MKMKQLSPRYQWIALNGAATLARLTLCRLAAAWLSSGDPLPRILEDAGSLGIAAPQGHRALAVLMEDPSWAAKEEAKAALQGIRIITVADRAYPEVLLQLPQIPPVLYLKGRDLPAPEEAVSIVGARKADAYGLEASRFFARHLAAAKATVISGLALGVDTEAHRGALEAAGGLTVAVLGSGLGAIYPKRNRRLAAAIAERGTLVSEFSLEAPPLARNFPVRNRIIAVSAWATLVIQATFRSGSLITARHAMELGRDVWALPGRIFDSLSVGANRLLRDGAGLAQDPDDLLHALPGLQANLSTKAEQLPLASEKAIALWRTLRVAEEEEPEVLLSQCGLLPHEFQGILLELEMVGAIRRSSGGRVVKIP